jgi:penicillin G amidase
VSRRIGAVLSLALALLFALALLDVGARGAGPLPPLGPAFNPGTGVLAMATGAAGLKTETLRLPGLERPVRVAFDAQGTAYVDAQTDHDLFLAIGYVQGVNRLFQMDLMRREGEGLLSQVAGPAALASDRLQLQLGLLRTARANWLALGRSSPARTALLAFSEGVNDAIRHDEATGTLPVMFKLLGYQPAPWTPIDTLVIQGDMTESLDYNTAPVEYAELARSLGAARALAWFPVQAANHQAPYDPGPYLRTALTPIASQTAVQGPYELMGGTPSNALPGASTPATASSGGPVPGWLAAAVLEEVATLTADVRYSFSDSNNWAVSGAHTASGQAMLAGDPHLRQTLPAIWYRIAGRAPGYDFSGVSIPGVPVILIGYNRSIAWSLTNVQNQATLFYRETTSAARPGRYLWRGAWRAMRSVRYTIPVKGEAPQPLTVRLTIHGPLIRQAGESVAVDWMGALPSEDLTSLLGIMRASDFQAFRAALRTWHAPSQNFVYADDRGNIGLISAGYYPEVRNGRPWTVLSGTGNDDIAGSVAFDAIPQAYDPESGLVFSANQRPVADDYPYYIGTALDFFDPGFRADQIQRTLSGSHDLTPASFAKLQTNTQDLLAAQMTPELLRALRGRPLTATERTVAALLADWHGNMAVGAPQATVWWFFLERYVRDTFGPWWTADAVPVGEDRGLALTATSDVSTPLVEDLTAWTASDPGNPAFDLPDGTHRTAQSVMAEAFAQAVSALARQLGPNPRTWTWGRVHRREFPSLAGIAALGYGPRPSGGDPFTVDAADGGLTAEQGPSWRMIVAWQGAGKPPLAEGVYPGGQSENPLSPLYEDQIATWWDGRYDTMRLPGQLTQASTVAVWRLEA